MSLAWSSYASQHLPRFRGKTRSEMWISEVWMRPRGAPFATCPQLTPYEDGEVVVPARVIPGVAHQAWPDGAGVGPAAAAHPVPLRPGPHWLGDNASTAG